MSDSSNVVVLIHMLIENRAIIASANHRTGKALHRMYDQDLASRSGIPNLSTNGNPDPWQLKPFSDGSDFSQCGLIEGVNDPVIGNLTTSMSQASVNNDDRSFQDPKSFVGGYQESESDFDNSGTCDVRDRPSAATGKEVSAKSRGSVE